MSILFLVLIIITCAVLAFFVLIQNPKGGGLAGSFGGLGNQMMGAKQSTDVVEKGTWISAAVLLVLTLGSFILSPKGSNNMNEKTRSEKVNKGVQAPTQQAPAQQAPAQQAPAQQNAPAPTQQAPAQGK
ncbi:MAG TPA: preprotein translocase subunit SecG [Chitinophagaceae bacterium]|nr:preprotein translocase subunit SecG [Chitinophagaceae bacterium]HNF71096.1 preprotein translocase subunit SecG [Chitinophagaceae bacterium]